MKRLANPWYTAIWSSVSMKVFFCALLISLGLIYGLNSAVDVAGLRSYQDVYSKSARQTPNEYLLWGKLFDQRAWVRARLVEKHECPELLILGSSTVSGLEPGFFQGRSVLNAWVTGPMLQDFEAVAQVLHSVGCHPQSVVLGADQFLVNEKMTNKRYMSLYSDYVAYQQGFVPKLVAYGEGAEQAFDRFKERLNFQTTRESLSFLMKGQITDEGPKLLSERPDQFCPTLQYPHYVRAYGGNAISCPNTTPTHERAAEIARSYVSGNGHEIVSWPGVNAKMLGRLRTLVLTLSQRGSHVILMGLPYHPGAYAEIRSYPEVRDKLESYNGELERLAQAAGGKFLNLRDPASVGCLTAEFEDAVHARAECLRKTATLIERMLQAPRIVASQKVGS